MKAQLNRLRARGLEIEDSNSALLALENLNYYRLAGYWYPFRKLKASSTRNSAQILNPRFKKFVEGHSFNEVLELYKWDEKLRILVFEAIVAVEVKLRTQVGHVLGRRSPVAHRNPECFEAGFSKVKKSSDDEKAFSNHEKWVYKIDRIITSRMNVDDGVTHQIKKYEDLHIWAVVELLSFSTLIDAYHHLKGADKKLVAESFSIGNPGVFYSMLRSAAEVRNVVAHHGRLWNANVRNPSQLPKRGTTHPELDHLPRTGVSNFRLYSVLCVLTVLSAETELGSTFKGNLKEHLSDFPEIQGISLAQAGFVEGWENQAIWTGSGGFPVTPVAS